MLLLFVVVGGEIESPGVAPNFRHFARMGKTETVSPRPPLRISKWQKGGNKRVES